MVRLRTPIAPAKWERGSLLGPGLDVADEREPVGPHLLRLECRWSMGGRGWAHGVEGVAVVDEVSGQVAGDGAAVPASWKRGETLSPLQGVLDVGVSDAGCGARVVIVPA